MVKLNLPLSCLVAVLAGCASPVPVADNFPISYQKVARTAHHWDVVADDVVAQTAATLQGMQDRPIFVAQPKENTTFDAAFRNFIVNHMVDRGMPVEACPVKATDGFEPTPRNVQVKYSTQVVSHSASMSDYRPGVLTALASGVWVGHGLANSGMDADGAYATGVGIGALVDWAGGHAANPTKTEIIVTTTIVENNRFLMRRSDLYYVPDADLSLFSKHVPRTNECATVRSVATIEIDEDKARDIAEEKANLQARLDWYLRNNPDWHGRIYSDKNFGVDGPVFVEKR